MRKATSGNLVPTIKLAEAVVFGPSTSMRMAVNAFSITRRGCLFRVVRANSSWRSDLSRYATRDPATSSPSLALWEPPGKNIFCKSLCPPFTIDATMVKNSMVCPVSTSFCGPCDASSSSSMSGAAVSVGATELLALPWEAVSSSPLLARRRAICCSLRFFMYLFRSFKSCTARCSNSTQATTNCRLWVSFFKYCSSDACVASAASGS
mmetsp:Transcript_99184/g.265239  ORF Transcript_99184/g.265239 Transcript_99184/m.265239 type:complete len:208 (+) Transcript_99184:2539-3162(+)